MTALRAPFPPGMLGAGRLVERLLSQGLPMGPLVLLRSRGRHSGMLREVPVAMLRQGGDQWLVSPFGAVAWVHNVRANGEAYLRRGATIERVWLEERHDAAVPGVLQAYRRRFAVVPFVRAAFTATGRDALDAFAHEAARHPVFHLQRTGPPTTGPIP